MAEANYDVGVRLKADGSGLVGETKQGVEALKSLEEQVKRTGAALSGQVSTSGQMEEKLRALIQRAGEAGINVKRLGEDVAKITSTQGAYNTILAKTIEQELRWAASQNALTGQTDQVTGALRRLGDELSLVWERKIRVSSIVNSIITRFGGPAGLIAMLGTAAAAWLGFGSAAERAAEKAEEAAQKARRAAEPPPTERERAHAENVRLALEIQERSVEIAKARANADYQRVAVLEEANRIAADYIRRNTWPTPAPAPLSIEEATKHLKTASKALEEYQRVLKDIKDSFGAEMARVAGLELPETEKQTRLAQLATRQAEFEAAARRQYEATLKSLEPKAPRAEGMDFAAVEREVMKLVAATDARAESTERLTRAEIRLAEIEAAYQQGIFKDATEERMAAVRAALQGAAATERAREARERERKAAEDAQRAYERDVEQLTRAAAARQQDIERLRQYNEEIGLNADELGRLKIRRAEAALAAAEEALALDNLRDKQDAHNQALQEEVRQRKEALELTREGAAKSAAVAQAKAAEEGARRAREAWDRTADHIERSLIDSILRGGKSARELLIDLFRTTVLTPILQPFVRPIAGAVSSVIGGITGSMFPGVAQAGGGFGGGLSLLSNAASFFSPMDITAAVAGMVGPAMGINSVLAAELATGAIPWATAAEVASIGAGAGLASLGGIGAALPWVGGALLLGGALGLFDDDDDGPKPSQIMLTGSAKTGFSTGDINIPGSAELYAAGWWDAVRRELNDPKKYDPAVLEQFAGRWITGAPGESAQSMVARLLQMIEPARQAVLQAAQIAAQRRQMDIRIMELEGRTAEALAARRQDELAMLDESLRAKQQYIYLLETQRSLAGREADLRGAVRGLPGRLGVDSLSAAISSLATSEYVAPLERFAAARAELQAQYERAIGGDLDAVRAFPGVVQQALAIGRDVYASGPQFAELFREGNRMLNELLAHQREIEADIVASVPATIREAASDQIAEIRRQTRELVDGLAQVKAEIQRLQTALAA